MLANQVWIQIGKWNDVLGVARPLLRFRVKRPRRICLLKLWYCVSLLVWLCRKNLALRSCRTRLIQFRCLQIFLLRRLLFLVRVRIFKIIVQMLVTLLLVEIEYSF